MSVLNSSPLQALRDAVKALDAGQVGDYCIAELVAVANAATAYLASDAVLAASRAPLEPQDVIDACANYLDRNYGAEGAEYVEALRTAYWGSILPTTAAVGVAPHGEPDK